MDTNTTQKPSIKTNRMLNNEEYFKHIFKKTEKIVCSVFYIVNNDLKSYKDDTVIADLKFVSKGLLDTALESLKSSDAHIITHLELLTHALLKLESHIRLAAVSGYVGGDVLNVYVHEIDSLHRTISKYISLAQVDAPSFTDETSSQQRKSIGSLQSPMRTQQAPRRSISTQSRKELIKTFLKDNPGSSIKDISAVITDCSEKTIQRELISLIKDNAVYKEGERRWSRYFLSV